MAVSQEHEATHRGSAPGPLSNFFSVSAPLPTFVHTCFPWQGQERLTGSEERSQGRLDLWIKCEGLVHGQ